MVKKKSKKNRRKRKNPVAKVNNGYQRLCEKTSQVYGSDLLVIPSPDGIKMSEVMQSFIQPYLGGDITKDTLTKVMSVAVVAWNAAMVPEQERKELFAGLAKAFPAHMVEEGLDVMEHMMDRKRQLFSDCTRFVYSYEIVEKKNSYQLLVTSAPGM